MSDFGHRSSSTPAARGGIVMRRHWVACRFVLAASCLLLPALRSMAEDPQAESSQPFITRSLRGRVVFLGEAMSRLHGVKLVAEARDRTLALETPDGGLHPILEDIRGRAFRRDQRLRDMRVELFVRQYRGAPLVQIIRVFELTDEGKFEVDYWCEICAISMFELKDCECCQGPIELRRQPVD